MTPHPPLSDDLRLAIAAAESGRFAEASAACRQILAAAPDDAAALALSGALAAQAGDLSAAIAQYRAALDHAPRFVKALSNLGAALLARGEIDEAERQFAAALAEDPDYAPALANLGQLRLRQKRNDEALSLLQRAVAAAPSDAMAWNNLGAAFLQANRYEDALAPLTRALSLAPRLPAALNNSGNVYLRLGRHLDAAVVFRTMTEILPNAAEAWTHFGTALRGCGRNEESLVAQDKALALKPDFADARFSRGLLLLAQGRLAEGWADYRARPSARAFRAAHRLVDTPRLPADLNGKSVLLLTNQGFGDELFFLRFVPQLKRRGARVIYRAGDKIAALVRPLSLLDEILPPGAGAPNADWTLLVDDLPYALQTTDTPPSIALTPSAEALASARAVLAKMGPAPYLGVTWRGGVDKAGSLFKIAPRAELARAVAAWPGSIVSLQRAPAAGEVAAFAAESGRPIHDAASFNDDLPAMLALLAALDDYVAVSNTNVHLRAAAGLISRLLVPTPGEWRWMSDGESTPWFPGARLYRQSAGGDWRESLHRLSADIGAHRL